MNIIARIFGILLFSTIGSMAIPASVRAATLFISPNAKTISVDEEITVEIKVDTDGQSINNAQATVVFPTERLEFKSLNTTNSIFTHWSVKPTGSNDSGRIVFTGGLPTPGYNGSVGTIISITWRAKKSGQAEVTITNGRVLANDGLGTDVLSGTEPGNFLIKKFEPPTPPTLSSLTHPDQNRWYQTNQAEIVWTYPAGMKAVSYVLDQLATTDPDANVEENIGPAVINFPHDGVWYFHLRGQFESGWSSTVHYRLRHDRTPPDPFTVELIRDRSESDPTPQIVFSAADAASGIDRYTISLDGQPAAPAQSPVVLTVTQTGQHKVTVVAFDRAGNSRTSQIEFTSSGYPTPTITYLSTSLILLEPLVVKGHAAAGDLVTIMVDGQAYGQVMAGQLETVNSGAYVRLPWMWHSNHLFGPGSHQVTVTATSPDGQTSVPSDPSSFEVTGATITFLGRPLATIAVAPAIGLVVVLLIGIIIFVMTRLIMSVIRLHQEELFAEAAVETMRRQILEGGISAEQVEKELEILEEDLKHPERIVKTKRKKRPTTR